MMRNFKYLLLFAALASFTLFSCSKKEDPPIPNAPGNQTEQGDNDNQNGNNDEGNGNNEDQNGDNENENGNNEDENGDRDNEEIAAIVGTWDTDSAAFVIKMEGQDPDTSELGGDEDEYIIFAFEQDKSYTITADLGDGEVKETGTFKIGTNDDGDKLLTLKRDDSSDGLFESLLPQLGLNSTDEAAFKAIVIPNLKSQIIYTIEDDQMTFEKELDLSALGVTLNLHIELIKE